ncbi:hypothetical protein ANANG_G00073850 [Anguilla anguilla]|uniref:Uncharacterized protein n=1 Tax=Anguilla anguilla TaxID=7936 RepID=A0A9D3MRI8_ANGAN|nr:hypothetical protein ANANG_G00073850 [Anguilla anguilla]
MLSNQRHSLYLNSPMLSNQRHSLYLNPPMLSNQRHSLYLNPPMLSEDTPMYLSLFFLAFFLSSLSRSSSCTNSTISFTFCRTLMPWSFPYLPIQ